LFGVEKQIKQLQTFDIDIKLLELEYVFEHGVHLFAVETNVRKVISFFEVLEKLQEGEKLHSKPMMTDQT
jgi:hypothetical protein